MNRTFTTIDSTTGPLLFDGLQAVCWFVNMKTNINAPRISNISPGEIYTFVFTQDATGGRVMNWPANALNAPAIGSAPNSITVVTFIGSTGALLYTNVVSARTQ